MTDAEHLVQKKKNIMMKYVNIVYVSPLFKFKLIKLTNKAKSTVVLKYCETERKIIISFLNMKVLIDQCY